MAVNLDQHGVSKFDEAAIVGRGGALLERTFEDAGKIGDQPAVQVVDLLRFRLEPRNSAGVGARRRSRRSTKVCRLPLSMKARSPIGS
jgi:hypothetical protein